MRLSFFGKKDKTTEPTNSAKLTEPARMNFEVPTPSGINEMPVELTISTKNENLKDDGVRQPESSKPSKNVVVNQVSSKNDVVKFDDDLPKEAVKEPTDGTEEYVTIDKLPASPISNTYTVGMKVTANYHKQGKFYPGVIKAIRASGSFDIDYADGESESNVPESCIRLPGAISPRMSEKKSPSVRLSGGSMKKIVPIRTYTIGNRVEARYRGRDYWKLGVIKKIRLDNSYDVLYDDGEIETRVDSELIRPSDAPITNPLTTLTEGTLIEANYKALGRYYPAVVIKNRPEDKTLDVEYRNGECEFNVSINNAQTIRWAAGTTIECNYRGKGKFYPGKINKDHGNGTYDVDYDDGEFETRVMQSLIRHKNVTTPSDAFKIEGNYKGKGKWYPGKIVTMSYKGPPTKYNLVYDDGETENNVNPHYIRWPITGALLLSEGVVIENYLVGTASWVRGEIMSVNIEDGTFGIKYVDGKTSDKVDDSLIRLAGVPDMDANKAPAAVSPKSPKHSNGSPTSSSRKSLNRAINTSKQLEVQAMEVTISSLQDKNMVMMEQIKTLQDDVEQLKVREKELTALMVEQGDMIKSFILEREKEKERQRQLYQQHLLHDANDNSASDVKNNSIVENGEVDN